MKSQIVVDDLHIKSIMSDQGLAINVSHDVNHDEAMIMAMGYKAEFKREFSLWTVFSVAFSVLGLLPSIAATFPYQQLVNGVSPVPWLICVGFVTCVALSLAEAASAFPVSAGAPYAVSQLAPPKYKAFFTWITCWSNWLCQVTVAASVNYAGALMILALVAYNSNFKVTEGKVYGVCAALQFSHAIIACLPTKWLAQFNATGTVTNIVFLAVVFVMILAGVKERPDGTKFNSNSMAWGFDNLTDYPDGIATLIAFLGVIWTMGGYDSPFHLAEECANAASAVPKAIIMTSSIGGLVGFLFMIAIAYTVVDVKEIAADPMGLGQPFVTYLSQIFTDKLLNTATALTIISSYFMGASCMLSLSRVTFAYSRDDLFPFSKICKRVNSWSQTPVNAVWVTFGIGQCLLFLMFAGLVAIGAIFSVNGIAAFVSFTMPTLMKLIWARDTFRPGPVHLGRFSTPIGIISCSFVLLMIPILCMPTVKGKNLTLDNMNWTCVVYFGPMLLVTIWYAVLARKWYKGPKSNLEEKDVVYFDEKDPVHISSRSLSSDSV